MFTKRSLTHISAEKSRIRQSLCILLPKNMTRVLFSSDTQFPSVRTTRLTRSKSELERSNTLGRHGLPISLYGAPYRGMVKTPLPCVCPPGPVFKKTSKKEENPPPPALVTFGQHRMLTKNNL